MGSEPEALVALFRDLRLAFTWIGLVAGPLSQWLHAGLTAAGFLAAEYGKLHGQLLGLVRSDTVCRRLMTTPGVGPVVAMTYKAAIDDPERFHRSKDVGPYFGLTPRKYQSGEVDWTVNISRSVMRRCVQCCTRQRISS